MDQVMMLLQYLASEWQRSPNPWWLKLTALLLATAGLIWLVVRIVQGIACIWRLWRMERIRRDTRMEYRQMIERRRDGAA